MGNMNGQSLSYSLADIDQLLPITSKVKMLGWLKNYYLKAQDAMDYGFEGATIIQHDNFVVTAEEITSVIDVKKGRIGQRGAQLLINIFNSGVLPRSLVKNGQEINPEFYAFAFD